MDPVKSTLLNVINEICPSVSEENWDNLHYGKDLELDILSMVDLFINIEDCFDIHIPDDIMYEYFKLPVSSTLDLVKERLSLEKGYTSSKDTQINSKNRKITIQLELDESLSKVFERSTDREIINNTISTLSIFKDTTIKILKSNL